MFKHWFAASIKILYLYLNYIFLYKRLIMHKNSTLRLLTVAAFIALSFFNSSTFAAAISSTGAGGNWNSGTTWAGGSVPQTGDDVTIVTGATVNLNGAPTAVLGSFTIQAGAFLYMQDGNGTNLNIGGNIVNNGTLRLWNTEFESGDLILGGNSVWSGSGIWALGNIDISTFNLDFAESMTINIARSIYATTGKINTNTPKTLTTLVFNGSVNATIPSAYADYKYPAIRVNKVNASLSFNSFVRL